MATNYLTFVDIVNKVLLRLRERPVVSVQDSAYSRLIGELVNKVKRDVENAYTWDTLRDSWQVYTTADVTSYNMTDAGNGVVFMEAYNLTTKEPMRLLNRWEADKLLVYNDQPAGAPNAYIPNGTSQVNDVKVDVAPVPDGAYLLQFNIYAPQGDLTGDTDVMAVPYRPVIEGTIALAMQERGEDGGELSANQYRIYQQALADAIALEASNKTDETVWYPR